MCKLTLCAGSDITENSNYLKKYKDVDMKKLVGFLFFVILFSVLSGFAFFGRA